MALSEEARMAVQALKPLAADLQIALERLFALARRRDTNDREQVLLQRLGVRISDLIGEIAAANTMDL